MVFGKNPQEALHDRGVVVTRFSGTDGRDIVRSHELQGNLQTLATDTLSLIREHTNSNYRVGDDLTMKATNQIPQVALRELVVNALIHRKYGIVAPVKVAIFDDRLEIFSPGELPPNITLEVLGDGTSQIRNVHLAKFARRLGLIEKLGSGIKEARRLLEESGFPAPEFIDQPTSFKVIIQTQPFKKMLSSPEKIVDQLLKKQSHVSKQDLVKSGVADRTASQTLSRLVAESKLRRVGKGRNTRYTR